MINDLALNHRYKKTKRWLIVQGFNEASKSYYEAFYSLKGEFCFIRLRRSEHGIAQVPWRQDYDTYIVEKIDWLGNSLTKVNTYATTKDHPHRLIEKIFTSVINDKKVEKKFKFTDGKLSSEGEFPKFHLRYWIN